MTVLFSRSKLFVLIALLVPSFGLLAEPGFTPIISPTVPAIIRQASVSTLSITTRLLIDGHESPEDAFRGTSFLIQQGNRQTLFTAGHNFSQVTVPEIYSRRLTTSEQVRRFLENDVVLDFHLFNIYDGEVFDTNDIRSQQRRDRPQLSYFTSDPEAYGLRAEVTDTLAYRIGDVYGIHLPTRLPGGLTLARQTPSEGERVYIVGFPRATTTRRNIILPNGQRAGDSDGSSLLVSSGTLMHRVDFFELVGVSEDSYSPLQAEMMENHLFYIDGDCEQGNSGGPILNAQGQVVGVLTGSRPDPRNDGHSNVCVGIRINDLNGLRNSWRLLNRISVQQAARIERDLRNGPRILERLGNGELTPNRR